jgi:hypothetical protein
MGKYRLVNFFREVWQAYAKDRFWSYHFYLFKGGKAYLIQAVPEQNY